jgi:cytochrome d ubiquinol oxidase subunit I
VVSVACVECGWIVTEVGRQPWIVYNVLTTANAVTHAGIARLLLPVVVTLYAPIAVVTGLTLRVMSRRWPESELDQPVPYGPVVVRHSNGTAASLARPVERREP